MKYFILILSLLILSGTNNYPQSVRTQPHRITPEINIEYLTMDAYQDDYKSLQEKSEILNIKIKSILDSMKPHY